MDGSAVVGGNPDIAAIRAYLPGLQQRIVAALQASTARRFAATNGRVRRAEAAPRCGSRTAQSSSAPA